MRERERGKIRIGLVKAKSVITARHALRLSQTNSDASTSFVTTYEFSIEGGGGGRTGTDCYTSPEIFNFVSAKRRKKKNPEMLRVYSIIIINNMDSYNMCN